MERRNFLKILGFGAAAGASAPAVSSAKIVAKIPGTIEYARSKYLEMCYKGLDREMFEYIQMEIRKISIAEKIFDKHRITPVNIMHFYPENKNYGFKQRIGVESNFPIRMHRIQDMTKTMDRTKHLCSLDFIGKENILILNSLREACYKDNIIGYISAEDISLGCDILKKNSFKPKIALVISNNLPDELFSSLLKEYQDVEILHLPNKYPICNTERYFRKINKCNFMGEIYILGDKDSIGSFKRTRNAEISHPEAPHKNDVLWNIKGSVQVSLNKKAIIRIIPNAMVGISSNTKNQESQRL